MRKFFLLAALCCPVLASAQTTTYTGTVRDLANNAVTSGKITWQLNAPSGGVIPGTGSFTSSIVSCGIDASGHPVAISDGVSPCVVTSNTALTPTGTSYTMCTQPNFVSPGSCIVTYATGGTVDISTIVPTPATQPSYGVASTAGNNTWGGTQIFSNAITGTSATFTGPLTIGASDPTMLGPSGGVNVMAEGAKCDGATDDYLAIQAAVNTTSGVVIIPNRRCLTTHDIVVSKSGVSFLGLGAQSEIYFQPTCPCTNGINHEAIMLSGSISTRRQIAAAVAVGATSFTLSSSSDGADLVAGEWLIAEEYDAGASHNQVVSTWVQVASVAGTTVNVFNPFKTAIPHLRTFTQSPNSGSSFYAVTNLVLGTTFRDVKITIPFNAGLAGGDVLPGIYINQGTRSTTLDHVLIDDASGDAIAAFLSSDIRMTDSRVYSSRVGGGGSMEFASISGMSIKNSYLGQDYTANSTSAAQTAILTIDNGTEFFDIIGNQINGAANISIQLNTAPHDGTITGNNIGYTSGVTGQAIIGVGVQRCVVTDNIGAGGAGYGIAMGDSSGWTVNVSSSGNIIAGNQMANYTLGATTTIPSLLDSYLTPGAGYWATKARTKLAAGLAYGDGSANAEGTLTLIDSANNTVLENTGGNTVAVKANGNYLFSADANGLHCGSSATLAGLNVCIPFGTTGFHGNGVKLQFNDGTGTNGNFASWNAGGSVVDAGVAVTSVPQKIASGTATMTTAAITAPACGTTVTVAATGVLTTDTIQWSFAAAPAGTNAGVVAWPTANNVNFAYCPGVTETPAAATLNWRVTR